MLFATLSLLSWEPIKCQDVWSGSLAFTQEFLEHIEEHMTEIDKMVICDIRKGHKQFEGIFCYSKAAADQDINILGEH